ncbi:condensation domain-containing protein [Kitasatospora albolonga]|uniref:condensation domain-containing protein n=1 Tax=Kitasatospora albolonga TaxID=68173 RepID=UPI0039BD12B9
MRVLTLTPDEHVLLVHAHHIIGDGYSAALLIRELTTTYDALSRGEDPALPHCAAPSATTPPTSPHETARPPQQAPKQALLQRSSRAARTGGHG